MGEHVRWERRRGRNSEAVGAGYDAAKGAYQLAQAVRARAVQVTRSTFLTRGHPDRPGTSADLGSEITRIRSAPG